jgi:hypothetical protein
MMRKGNDSVQKTKKYIGLASDLLRSANLESKDSVGIWTHFPLSPVTPNPVSQIK